VPLARGVSFGVVGLAVLCAVGSAHAEVEGATPTKVANWRLYGSHSALGAALMVPGPSYAEINSVLLSTSTSQVTDLPFDAEVVAAYLFWSGSSPRNNGNRGGNPDPPDRDVDFTVADGTTYNNLSIDTDYTGFGRCSTVGGLGGFYYCRRDVTDIIRLQGPGNANGIYRVGDVLADAGTLNGGDPQWVNAQAKYAGWALVLVWRSSTVTVRRDVVLYDGFMRLDETQAAAGLYTFTIGDFLVGSPPLGKLSVFGMEGDRQLGVPPQDSTGCPNCWDSIWFKSNTGSSPSVLSNGLNPAHNSFNSSTDVSIDIDTYDLGGLIRTADNSATITVGSGDGIVDALYNQGNGESFNVGWIIMTVDTLTPNFGGMQTKKRVLPANAGPGQRLYYLIDVVNEGSLAATNVIVQDAIPAGSRYVAGSTRVDGSPRADVGGTTPLVAGLNLGTIPTAMGGDNSRQVTFEVEVLPAACGGVVENYATVRSSQTDPTTIGPARTTVATPTLDPPTKAVSFISPPPIGPGAAYSYTIDVNNAGAQPAAGVKIVDVLPAAMKVSSVLATSGTWSQVGNTLTVTDITVSANGSAQVVVVGRVLTTAEFLAAGVPESTLDGLLVSNQATVSGGCTVDQLTDDPDVGGFQPTVFSLTYGPVLSTSSKTGVDANGGRLEPGDTIHYSVNVVNTGNRVADVVVRDAMPANTAYVPGTTRVDGVLVPDVGGVSALVAGRTLPAVPYVGDNDRLITFDVTVDALAANGALIANTAHLVVPTALAANRDVTSTALAVVAAADLSTSTKAVTDLTAPIGTWAPGDAVAYTLTINNTGNRVATNVVARDALPPELIFVSADKGGTFDGTNVIWPSAPTVPAGGSRTYVIQATVRSPLDNGLVITNVGRITCAELPETLASVSFTVSSSPLLAVTKVDDHPTLPAKPGDAVTYRIRLRNDGNMLARNVLVTDDVDASLVSISAPTGIVAGRRVTWSPTTDPRLATLGLGAGNAVELTLVAVIAAPLPNGTAVANQATATPSGFPSILSDDPDVGGASDPTVFLVQSQASLTFTKSVQDLSPLTPYQPGDRVRYTLTVTAGGDAPVRDLSITDTLPATLTTIDASLSNGSVTGNLVSWSSSTGAAALGRLNPGQAATLTVEATIVSGTADGTLVDNQAAAASADLTGAILSDGDVGTAGAQVTRFRVVAKPFLTLVKTVALVADANNEFNPGDTIAYTLVLTNSGTAPASGVTLTDTFDSRLAILDAAGGTVAAQAVTWSFGGAPLAAGASVTVAPRLKIAFPLDAGTELSNQASAASSGIPGPVLSDDPTLPGLTDPTKFKIKSAPDFTKTTKSVRDLTGDPLVTRPGDTLEYTLIVRNDGDSDADHVVVDDVVPAEVTVTVPANARFDGTKLTWDVASGVAQFGRFAAGSSVTLMFTTAVKTPLANGTHVSNQAHVVSDEIVVPVPSDDPATVALDDPTVVTVVSAADLGGSTKSVTNLSGTPITIAKPNDPVRYSLTITNRGDAAATNVVVTDVVSPSLLFVSAPTGRYDTAAISVTWDQSAVAALASVAPLASVVLTFDAKLKTPLDDGLIIPNQGSIRAAGIVDAVLTDANLSTLAKEETVLSVVSLPDLVGSTKVFVNPTTGAPLTQARPGDAIRMLLTLINKGDAIAKNVNVSDAVDTTLLTNISARDGGSFAGGVATWTVAEVTPGTSVRLRLDARLRSPLDPTTLVNQAFIGIGGPPTIPTDDPAQPGVADPTRLPIVSSATLDLSTKNVTTPSGGRTVAPGDPITYTIDVKNTGDANGRNVVLRDQLSADLSDTPPPTVTGGGVYDALTRTVSWSFAVVPGGGHAVVTITTAVASGAPNGRVIDNRGELTADGMPAQYTDDPLVATPDTPTRVTVVALPSLATFQKSVERLDATEPGLLRPGDRLRYTLTLRNNGNAAATNVAVRDLLDPGLLTDAEPGTPFRVEGNELVFDASKVTGLGSLAPGAAVDLVFIARVAAGVADGTNIPNQGFATVAELVGATPSDDPNTAAALDPTVVTVRYPELVVTKSVTDKNGGDVEPGDSLAFTIKVANRGSFPADAVTVTDTVDAALVDVAAPGSSVSGSTLTWVLGTIGSASEISVGFTAKVAATATNGTLIKNKAMAQRQAVPAVPAVSSNEVSVSVVSVPRLDGTTKAVSSTTRQVAPGELLTYTIDIPNAGRAVATNARVIDVVDSNLEVVSADSGGLINGQTVTWQLGTLAIDDHRTLTLRARVRAAAPNAARVPNQALVTANELSTGVRSDDPTTAEVDDPTVVTVFAEPTFVKTTLVANDLNGDKVAPGDRIRYQLQVLNSGTAKGNEVAVRMPLPAYVEYVPGSTRLNGVVVADTPAGMPLAGGFFVWSQRAGTDSGVVLADDGILPADEAATLTFEVQIDPRAVPGTIVTGQAMISSREVPLTPSDNPATPGLAGDPTVFVVGGGPELVVRKSAQLVRDLTTNGHADVGDTLRYAVLATNAGDATAPGVTLTDRLPAQGTYAASTLTVDGLRLTDSPGDDSGEVTSDGVVTVRLGDLAPGAVRTVTVDVTINAGPWLANQAELSVPGRVWLSDGDAGMPGPQPTVTPVDASATVLGVGLSAADLNGGVVDAGDRLSFVLEAVNQGDKDVSNISFSVARPTLSGMPVIVESGAATLVNADPPTWSLGLLKSGERVRLVFEADVAADAPLGGLIETHGAAVVTSASFETERLQVTVGGGVGSGGFRGKVFRDKGGRDGRFTEGADEIVSGFSVVLVPESKLAQTSLAGGEAPTLGIRTVVADKDGNYAMPGIPPGRYELWLTTAEGVTFARSPVLAAQAGGSVSQDLAIDPSGIIYQELDGAAVATAGARVFLVDVDTAQDLPRSATFGGQQGQVTTGQGFYRFDVVGSALPRRVYIRVEPPSATLVFPSATRPPQGATAQNQWGDPATAPADGRIVDSDIPDLTTPDMHYFLRFDLDSSSPNFTNNHIPVDRLDQHLKIVKQASRRTAQVGEVVTYTVRITNPLDQGFAVDSGGQGGLLLVDDLPEGMQWAKDEASIVTTVPAGTGTPRRLGIKAKTARTITFNALSLPAHSTVTVRYYLVVGIRAKGEQRNRARLMDSAGTIVSNEASATVRIIEDPIFDQGTVLGRVFCDDGDGEIGADDPGLPGARVYLDTGYFVDTDIEGKFHFRGVPAGRHLLKLDPNTVPVGSAPTTDVRRDFYLSRGLLTKINFGVKCGWEAARPTHVTLKHAPAPPPLPAVTVSVDPILPGVSLDGTAQPLPLVDAVLTLAGGTPNFASGEGLNLAGSAALTWHVQAASRVRIERWEVSVFTPEGVEVWRVAGEGRPPARIPWELTADNLPFESGKIYVYRIVARTPEGDLGEGVWRRLGYRFNDGKAPAVESGPPVVWNDVLFEAQTDKPGKLLSDKIAKYVAAARAKGPLPMLTVESHSYFSLQRSANLVLSQRQAVMVVELLVKAGYPKELLKGVGKGDVEPLMPNVSRKARELNRRIVLRPDVAAVKIGPLPPLAYDGFLLLNEELSEPDAERVEREITVEDGTKIAIDLRQANGRRLVMTRTFPFATAPTTEGPSVELMVFGSVDGSELTLGADKVSLPLMATECGLVGEPPRLGEKGLDPPARFRIKAGVGLRSWLVRILNPEGTVLSDLTGEGAPPEQVEWAGTGATGAVVVRPATYSFRCLLTDDDGNRTVSARQTLALDTEKAKPAYSKLLGGELYPKADGLQPAVMEELDKVAAAIKASPGSSVRIEAHESAEGGKAQAQVHTARLVAVIRTALVTRGVDEKLVDGVAFGAAKPLMPGASNKATEMNRRVLIEVHPPVTLAGFADLPAAPHAKVAGVELPVAADGTFTGKIVSEPDAALTVDVCNKEGHSAVYTVPLFGGRPADVPTLVVPRGFKPTTEEPCLGSQPATLMSPPAPEEPELAAIPGSGGSKAEAAPTFHESLVGDGSIDAMSGFKAEMPAPHLAAPSSGPRLVPPSGPPRLVSPSGPPGTTASEADEALAVAASAEAGTAGAAPAAQSAYVPLDEAPTTSAADLDVWLPPDGASLRGERLAIRGRSDAHNIVRINGEAVALDEYGRFFKVMVLKPGDAQIDVVAEDLEGNTTKVARTYRVPDWEWFLLAMGDGVAGWGNKLEGMNNDTTWDSTKGSYPDRLSQDLYLNGRAVGYFKGRVKGSALFAKNPFEEVRLTAHVDTGKPADRDLMKQLIDPERYYPVYGDAAEETQDVTSRSKVYVLLEADKSRFIVGNFKTEIDGIELFRFHRSYFGASLDVDKEFVQGYRTEAHALAASGTNGVRHRQVLLQGTGGSMYFLKDGEIVEGSERIEIVVRDAITGQRLASVPQTRDVTYNISYREGRVIFTEPVPSVASAGWRLTQNNTRTLDGNPILIQVEYDYTAPALDNGEKAYAFQARQSIGDRVTVGGGVVTEDRTASGGATYELYGVDAKARVTEQTRVTAELAYSKAQDAEHLVSVDGGVTYGQLGSPQQYQDNGTGVLMPTKAHGWAGKLTVAGDLGEFVPRPEVVSPTSEFLPYNLYFQYQDPYFYSGNNILEQGQTKVGGQVKAVLTEEDSVKLRHDGVWSRLFLATEERRVDRQLTTATYEHTGDGWKAGAEVGNTFWDDGTRAITTQSVAGFGEKRVLPRLTLLGQQELILRGDPNVVDSAGDHFVTTAGARYQLGESVFATATESVRWSGSNSATVGLKTGLMDDVNVYANERVTTDQSRTVSTTVVGGESTAIPGSRSYGEYQLDSLASGRTGRAVFGMDNKWTLLEGLRLNLSYERAQLVGKHQGVLTGDLGYAVQDRNTTGYGSTALGRDQQFSASGYSSAGVFPVGVSSRDAFAVGLELLRQKTLKAAARFEMRYDRGDQNLGAHDRMVFFGQAGGDWRLDRYLVVLGRLQGATVQNLDYKKEVDSNLGFTEGQFMDVSVGVALRPVHTDVVNGLFKWTRRYERRPTSVELTQFQLEVSDVVSLEEAFEVGGGVQVVTKVATKLYEVRDADLPAIRSTTLLALARVNYHLTNMFDAGAEYRWLGNFLTEESEHGPLFELAWIPVEYVAVGVGYNFTHYSDDLLADPRVNQHGFFLRVTARY
jgi:uncharacterized repeat protein (TIGR01451 family)